MLFGNFEKILSYFAEAAVEAPGYGLVDDEALPLNMIRAIMDNKWGDVKIEFKWKPETFSHCSTQYRREVNAGRFIIEEEYDARLALFAFLEKNGFEVPCPFESFIRKTSINVNDYGLNKNKKFGYWGMMSLALSRFEFSNNKFTVYLAVPPFIPKTNKHGGRSFFPDHLFLFGLEPYTSEVYNDQLKTVLNQTEEFLCGKGSIFNKSVVLSHLIPILQRQKRSIPLHFNIMPMPSSPPTSYSYPTLTSPAVTPSTMKSPSVSPPTCKSPPSEPQKTEKQKSFKGAKSQAERTRARKLKRIQAQRAESAIKENNTKKTPSVQKVVRAVTTGSEPATTETTDAKSKCESKKRPKTHFRKTKKPGRV